MNPLFDIRCRVCDHTTEVRKRFHEAYACPRCGGETKTLLTAFKSIDKAKDPFDLISTGSPPPSKPIKSFATDKRRGGKNTV